MKWLQLLRIPNTPSAIANVLAGFLLANGNWSDWQSLLCLVISSVSFYWAGMALNDVFDIEVDRIDQPQRPIPSGRISLQSATVLGWGLLGLGVALAAVAGSLTESSAAMATATCIAVGVALAIFLYDGPFKRTPLAPLLMGACRSLNILLGASTAYAGQLTGGSEEGLNFGSWVGIPVEVWWASLAIGVLITGVTMLARNESSAIQNRSRLAFAGFVMMVGFALLAALPWCPGADFSGSSVGTYPVLVGLIALVSVRRVVNCIADARAQSVKLAIVSTLRSLIVFDAAICFLARPDHLAYALCVLVLIIPTLVLSKWVYST